MVELSVASENGITVRDVERREFVMSVSPCCHLILSIFFLVVARQMSSSGVWCSSSRPNSYSPTHDLFI